MSGARAGMYTVFGKKVKIALIQHDMSSHDLAKTLGWTESTVCDVLKGRNNCERRKKEIAEILNIVY